MATEFYAREDVPHVGPVATVYLNGAIWTVTVDADVVCHAYEVDGMFFSCDEEYDEWCESGDDYRVLSVSEHVATKYAQGIVEWLNNSYDGAHED